MTFRFAPDAKVIVQPGAKLTLDNTIFTSVEESGRRWAGVEVWGDRTKTQDSWDHAGFNDFQGHIIVRNQSEIKNALTAITAASRNPDGSIVWSTCGGIVQLENSGFTNNKTAIWIGGYSNFMPASSNQRLNRRPNRGYIHNCDFLTNDDFIGDMDFQSFVHLQNGGSKLFISGNRFTNLSSAAWIDRGTGIKAIQHPIVVTPLCTSTSPPCIKNEFHDLLRGIDASGFTPSNNIVISNCIFNSTYRGILLTNTTSSIITEKWTDGGNIDLGDVVKTTAPWDAYQQFNELMGMSPYISEEVLISMINNPVFTALMVKLVCVANPQASRNDAVLNALSNRNPPMPAEYIDDILAERDSYSPLDELRANAGADYHLLRTIQKEIVAWYRNDSILGTNPAYYDSLVNFLSTMPGLTDKYELALTYMEFGDFGSMQNILDNIPFSFELSEIENQEHIHTIIAFGIAQTILEEELMPGQLTQNQIDDLTDILEHGIAYTHEMALALLKWNNHRFAFEEFILDYTPQQQRKVKRSKKTSEPNLEVFPNPARDYFTLIYKVPETNKGYPVILITDITGRVIHRIDAQSYSGDVLVDATNFVSGVYSVSLITADNRCIIFPRGEHSPGDIIRKTK
jgi:hypothetical protein